MVTGPVQMLAFGFDRPDFQGEVITELDRLRENGLVRLADALVVYKDADGDVAVYERSDLTGAETREPGTCIGALIGLSAAGEVGAEAGADGLDLFDEDDLEDLIEDLPNDSAAAVVLLEHRWAVPLREAVRDAGGVPLADEWVHPLDLVAVGLMAAEEAEELLELYGDEEDD